MLKLRLIMASVVATAQSVRTRIIRLDGVGDVKIGMTLDQLSATLHQKFPMPEQKEDQGCFYVSPRDYPSLMIENGKVVRVDVDQPGIPTAEGIQVGDTEAHVKENYGQRLEIKPSQYSGEEGGHHLTLRSKDGRYGVRFETDAARVSMFYAGTYDAIQYVEGCQ
jgi:hypothetical protein